MTFAIENRRKTSRCVVCGMGAMRVAVTVQKEWQRSAWRKVRRVRGLCLACIQSIKAAPVPVRT